MKKNIMIVGFVNKLVNEIAHTVANKLNYFFCNSQEMLEYSLLNADEMIVKCGEDYFIQQEKKVLKNICNFESTLISMNYNLFSKGEKLKIFEKNFEIIYIEFTPDQLAKNLATPEANSKDSLALDIIDYDDRNNYLVKNSNYVVAYNDVSIKKIISDIVKYLKGKL